MTSATRVMAAVPVEEAIAALSTFSLEVVFNHYLTQITLIPVISLENSFILFCDFFLFFENFEYTVG